MPWRTIFPAEKHRKTNDPRQHSIIFHHLSIIYQSSISHVSLLFTSEIFDPIYPISRTPSFELRRRGSDFGRTLCGCCRLFFRALPWHHGQCRTPWTPWRCHTQVVSNTVYWVNWWTNISLSPPYLTWWVLLRKGNTSIQSSAMNEFAIYNSRSFVDIKSTSRFVLFWFRHV